jgi:ABC-2 type transport system ATP-binding protein
MIRFDHIWHRYGAKVAVADLTLAVPRGELFALLGPNGAGKTTTIKMLVGLLRPDSGSVHVAGHDAAVNPREAVQALGYLPDEPFLYEKLSGREFLEFVAEMRGMDRPEALRRVARQVAAFELDDFLDDLTESYSHGMKQRLVLAAALVHDPAVLILDEPMVGLDPRSARMVKDLLRRDAREGVTVFMSTHMLALAEEIADRIGILNRGRLVFLGTVAELQRELACPQAALESLFLDLTGGGAERPAAPVPDTAEPS